MENFVKLFVAFLENLNFTNGLAPDQMKVRPKKVIYLTYILHTRIFLQIAITKAYVCSKQVSSWSLFLDQLTFVVMYGSSYIQL